MKKTPLRVVDKETVDIGISQDERENVVKKLEELLATTYTLYMKTLNYHWNVTGGNFAALHDLFEGEYQDLHGAGDEIAERIRALGHFTPGTFRTFLEKSAIKEDSDLPIRWKTMVENLMKDHETCSKVARDVIKAAEIAEDEVTIDMMVARMSFHDKAAWMLRATIQ